MRIQINLASKPFVELGQVFKRLRVAMAALGVTAAALGGLLYMESSKADVAQAQLATLRNKTSDLQRERSRNEARMHQPVNAAALERSRFLNELFLRKSFSWTAVMMDLENVLPAGVQVSSIEPQIGSDGDVHIRLRVMGDRDKAVELIRNLEHSRRFAEPRLASESLQTSGNQPAYQLAAMGNVEFDILSGYNPLAPRTEAKKETAKEDTANSKKDAITPAKPVVRTPAKLPAKPAVNAPGGQSVPIRSGPPVGPGTAMPPKAVRQAVNPGTNQGTNPGGVKR
ncbi:PilN domain-containing protein [Terriglobus albidus]|uniref:PilN domain-containing protein n=1 Tax=Terriglobus albidus TaxID=1592106 RepID=UPI0021DF461E|nr:PilN domain-containing protein [Terriglobus albidus]